MKIGDTLVRDMSDEQLRGTRTSLTQQLNLAMAQTLKAIENQVAFGAMVNVIAYEMDRRQNAIVIAGSAPPNGKLVMS